MITGELAGKDGKASFVRVEISHPIAASRGLRCAHHPAAMNGSILISLCSDLADHVSTGASLKRGETRHPSLLVHASVGMCPLPDAVRPHEADGRRHAATGVKRELG